MRIIIALLLFSIIVMFHEFGHFLLAKKNGICVEEFALGIGPTLIGFTKGETKYCIKCLPFGGCCMMLGEDGDNDDPRAFGSKSPAARFWVIFAGPLFNFILAFIFALFTIGFGGAYPNVIGTVAEGSGAYEAGLKAGDKIVKMDNSTIMDFREITLYNMLNNENPDVEVTYVRDGQKATTLVHRQKDNGSYILGVTMTTHTKQNFFGVIKYSFLELRYQIKSTILSLKYLLSGKASLNDMSGPVGIVNMVGDVYEESIIYGIKVMVLSMMNFAILLSANLGVMNLLPIPALDGGRIIFILLEMIRGKKIDPDKEGFVHFIGLILLLALMLIIMGNDIRKIFF